MAPALEVEELSKRHGDVVALEEVSLRLEEGECVALLGPNGAGKSTLLECVTTIREPTSGEIRVGGTPVDRDPMVIRGRIGVAFQEPLVSKHLTANEVLVHHARLYGTSKQEATERARSLLDFVDLADRAGDRVTGFSGGMKRRLDLARVLMTDPELLLLDEPTSGLDPRARGQMHERLRGLIETGTTLLIATHDLDEAERLADRVIILDRGRIVASGEPDDLSDHLGRRVVEIAVGTAGREHARGLLENYEGIDLVEHEDGLEIVISAGGPTPGAILDSLDEVAYEKATLREPGLADVFLEVTGRRFSSEEEIA